MSRVMYQDESLPHQIRIFLVTGGPGLAVSCCCLRKTKRSRKAMSRGPASFEPIEVRTRWDADEAQAVYRAHLAGAEAAAS